MAKLCGNCEKYYPLKKGQKGKEPRILERAYCLARTIFPKNRPGNPVYPPEAKIEETEQNMILAHIVRKRDPQAERCPFYTDKKEKKNA